ncbi:MAG TPA: PQQ-binding-like beta-propeller repeat protein [Bryobacteraceae bacterium]|nr:PQQ-binding-like beta-propeller repeat protein [Bryobacteraceae bacterium]
MHLTRTFWRIVGLAAVFSVFTALLAAATGEEVYKKRCSGCHDQSNSRIPPRDTLQKMPAARILKILDFGVMMQVAYHMPREEREAVAKFLGTDGAETVLPAEAFCKDRTVSIDDKSKFVWDGWSPKGDNARFETADVAGLSIDQVKKLKLKWAFGYDGDVNAFAFPAFFDGQIFVGSARGTVHALRAESGCVQWTYDANGPVRSAMIVVPNGARHTLLFGDQIGWYYALEAETGKLIWKKHIEDHDTARLTGAALVHDGVVYVPVASWEETRSSGEDYLCCTFRGSLVALRIRDGQQVWKSYMVGEPSEQGKTASGKVKWGPSGASIWSTPVYDTKRNLIYVTTGDNFSAPATLTSDALVAINPADGKIVWASQTTANDVSPSEKGPDFDFGAPPVLIKTPEGRELVLAGQKSGIVYAFDPDKKGEVVWQTRVGRGGANGGVQWGLSYDGQKVYAAVSDRGSKRATDANGAPIRMMDPEVGGGLTALKVSDGSKVWFAAPPECGTRPGCSPAQSAALTTIPGAVFSGTLGGILRAYSTEDGKVLWEYDTAQDFKTVNGVKAKGGAIDGPGPMVIKGMVFVNSGYSRFGGLPGNVLLAFEPESR